MSANAERAKEVAIHHVESLKTRDVETVMEDYASDVVMLCNLMETPVKGEAAMRESIKGIFEGLLTAEVAPQIKILKVDSDGDVAYISYTCGTVIPFATDTYILKDGKIAFETAVVQLAQG